MLPVRKTPRTRLNEEDTTRDGNTHVCLDTVSPSGVAIEENQEGRMVISTSVNNETKTTDDGSAHVCLDTASPSGVSGEENKQVCMVITASATPESKTEGEGNVVYIVPTFYEFLGESMTTRSTVRSCCARSCTDGPVTCATLVFPEVFSDFFML